jgi:hypothetical protein
MADVASKQQTTAWLLSTTVTCTRRHTELTRKLTNLMGNLFFAIEHSVQFFVPFFYTGKLQSLTYSVWDPLGCMGQFRVYGTLYGIWGNLECMGPFRVFGALQGVWSPLECRTDLTNQRRPILGGRNVYTSQAR